VGTFFSLRRQRSACGEKKKTVKVTENGQGEERQKRPRGGEERVTGKKETRSLNLEKITRNIKWSCEGGDSKTARLGKNNNRRTPVDGNSLMCLGKRSWGLGHPRKESVECGGGETQGEEPENIKQTRGDGK